MKRQQFLFNELQHRVNNMLTTIRAVARRTRAHRPNLDQFAKALDDRLSALARIHNLFSHPGKMAATMREILTQELSAQGAVEGNNFVQRGPDITLPAREAELLSMAFHELATNAVKHGALSAKDGRICITWVINRAENGEHVLLRWRERVSQLSSLQYSAVLALNFLKNQSSICLAAVLTEHFILTELNVRCSFGLKLTLPRPVSDMPRRYRSWRANNNETYTLRRIYTHRCQRPAVATHLSAGGTVTPALNCGSRLRNVPWPPRIQWGHSYKKLAKCFRCDGVPNQLINKSALTWPS